MKFIMKKILLFCLAIFFSNSVCAADYYALDPNHTNITWSANHYGFSNVSGKFTQATGYIIIDEAQPNLSSVDVTINTSSISTGLPKFDETLKGANFFNSAKYPEAHFTSKSMILRGRNASVVGDFTLLGITKEITLEVRLNKIGLNSYTQNRTAGFSASTTIKRSDFGMNFGIPGISDNVRINIEVEGSLDKEAKKKLETPQNQSLIQDQVFKETPWRIVSETSRIEFSVNQMNSVVNGSFNKLTGKVAFNPFNLENSAVSVDIDISSIRCSINEAISELLLPEWFNVKKFPKANFTATNFSKTADGNYSARGTLNLKGRNVPTNVNFKITSQNNSSASISGTANIKRSDFGIGNLDIQKAKDVNDDVQIKFNINAVK